MNKIFIVSIFFITFLLFETLLYYIYKNKNTMKESFLLQKNKTNNTNNTNKINNTSKTSKIKEPFLETYQGSDTNFESCKKSGYPHQWCLHLQEPYSIPNPDSLKKCVM